MTSDEPNPHRILRLLSLTEGLSLLVLLLVAMPLKYALGYPLAVSIVGMLHGLLFLTLIAASGQSLIERALTARLAFGVVALSVVPFGFVIADRLLRQASSAQRS